MCGKQLLQITVAMIVLLVVAGCAGTSAPSGWLPKSTESPIRANGAWAKVDLIKDGKKQTEEGELIAVHNDSLFILTGTGLDGLDQRDISNVKLTAYQPEGGKIGGWTLAGCLMSFSHGFFMGLSIPAWIITGSIAGSSVSREPMIYYNNPHFRSWGDIDKSAEVKIDESKRWKDLKKWARFPQGLPSKLDRKSLGSLSIMQD